VRTVRRKKSNHGLALSSAVLTRIEALHLCNKKFNTSREIVQKSRAGSVPNFHGTG
jgi:hypothetical protein